MAALVINGVAVNAPEGAAILAAAAQAGIKIPTLCHHRELTAAAVCGLCLVEVEGLSQPVPACQTPAADGMIVSTETAKLKSLRRDIIAKIIASHPTDCHRCKRVAECAVYYQACELELDFSSVPHPRRRKNVESSWPLIEYDPNYCILCLRCVRVCREVQGVDALIPIPDENGFRIGVKEGRVLNCEFCGQCVAQCPTQALRLKAPPGAPFPWELAEAESVCPLCSAGCRLELRVRNHRIYSVSAREQNSLNQGKLCFAGRFGLSAIHHPERLSAPYLRRKGELQPVSWAEALDYTAWKLKGIIERQGPESVAALGSPRLTNEDNYALQKFMRLAIGSNNLDSEARFNFMRVERALAATVDGCGATAPLDELMAAETLFLIGLDPAGEVPALAWKLEGALNRKQPANLILAASRDVRVGRRAQVRLRYRPYAENHVLLGLMKTLLELELWDKDFVAAKVMHFLSLQKLLAEVSWTEILEVAGLPRAAFEAAALLLGGSDEVAFIFGGDLINSENSPAYVANLANLALLTGNLHRPRAGLYPIYEKTNLQGLVDMGMMPEYLPGYQTLNEAREKFARAWEGPLPFTRGLTFPEIIRGIEQGEVRALYLAGGNPLATYPNYRRLEQAFRRLECLVAQDLFLGLSARMAHVVFPAASFAEKEGSYTNLDHRWQHIQPALEPYRESLPDWRIFSELAARMGKPLGFSDAVSVTEEIARLVPGYSETESVRRGRRTAAVWPRENGRKYLFKTKPYSFLPVRERNVSSEMRRSYPFVLVTGKTFFQFGGLSAYADAIREISPRGYAEMNPHDVLALGLRAGENVRIVSAVDSLSAPIRAAEEIPRGVIFIPRDFPELPVNRLFCENTNLCRVRAIREGDEELPAQRISSR